MKSQSDCIQHPNHRLLELLMFSLGKKYGHAVYERDFDNTLDWAFVHNIGPISLKAMHGS